MYGHGGFAQARPRVAVVGLRGVPGVMGGIETHCENLYPRLSNGGAASFTVIGRSPYLPKGVSEFKGVRVCPLFAFRSKLLETILHTPAAIVYARCLGADIVHIHAVGPALFTPLVRLLGMRAIVTHHGADYDRSKWSAAAKRVLRMGERAGVAFCDEMIVVGPSLAQRLKESHPRAAQRISFVPNGAALPDAPAGDAADVTARFGLEPGRYVLAVGRLVPEKGFHDLLAAFEKAVSPYTTLVIVGGADHEDAYSQALRAHESSRVRFLGVQRGAALRALFSAAGVFVLPSMHEGLPIVALEALAAGAPVLLSDITPNRDIGLPQECYFPVGNTEALAERLSTQAPETPSRQVRDILRKHDWDAVAMATQAIYQRLAARAAGGLRAAGKP